MHEELDAYDRTMWARQHNMAHLISYLIETKINMIGTQQNKNRRKKETTTRKLHIQSDFSICDGSTQTDNLIDEEIYCTDI